MLSLQAQTEGALEELENMLNLKVANFQTQTPTSTLIRLDETTNHLFVYNLTTREWVEYLPA
jgi:hypothetical protein